MSTMPGNLERRVQTLEAARKELEDALIVTAHLQQCQSQLLKEQSEYVASHEERIRGVDEGIERLVSAIGALISHRPQ